MHILVTGGAGFIGSALTKRLLADGHSVVVLDNFNDYYDVALKRARERTFLGGATVIEGDITHAEAVDAVLADHRFDLVAHFAGNAGVRYSIDAPLAHVDGNIAGTTQLLEAMKRHGVSRLVFASTSSVYGNDSTSPFREDAPADRPMSVYGASKRSGELIAHTYYTLFGIETTCLRFFTVYGPWTRPDMAILKFAELMAAGKPVDVYNHGDLRRDFTHIDDIVEGFVRAIETPLGYEIINLGRGETTELMRYIELLEAGLGITAEKNFLPMQPGDVYETYADTTKAQDLLGFTARVPIEAGMQTFTDWFTSYYGGRT